MSLRTAMMSDPSAWIWISNHHCGLRLFLRISEHRLQLGLRSNQRNPIFAAVTTKYRLRFDVLAKRLRYCRWSYTSVFKRIRARIEPHGHNAGKQFRVHQSLLLPSASTICCRKSNARVKFDSSVTKSYGQVKPRITWLSDRPGIASRYKHLLTPTGQL
jgi:hypothetical protein